MPPGPTVASRQANASNAAGFQATQTMASLSGNINNRGAGNVDAVATPVGHYYGMVISAIKQKWYVYSSAHSDMVAIGTVHIHFIVDRSGRVTVPRVISNSSNEALATVSLQALLDAAIPPMPPTVEVAIKGELSVDMRFELQ